MADELLEFPAKDPGENLDYSFDFTNLLEAAEEIQSFIPTISPITSSPLTTGVSGIDVAGKIVTIWFSGGLAGTTYNVTVAATTDVGAPPRIFERSCLLPVKDR